MDYVVCFSSGHYFPYFLAIAVFIANVSDNSTDTNGIIEYEEIRN